MSGATRIIADIEPGSELWGAVYALDRFGFTLFDTRISAWTVVVALGVLVAALLLARLTIKVACWLIGKMHGLDTAQRLLAQKLVSIAVWTMT